MTEDDSKRYINGKDNRGLITCLLDGGYESEWYGRIYVCQLCGNETMNIDAKFCEDCGARIQGKHFDSIIIDEPEVKE